MKKGEQIAIGLSVIGIALAYYWSRRQDNILGNIAASIKPTPFQPLQNSGTVTKIPPYQPPQSISPSTGGPVTGNPTGDGSIDALPGAIAEIPPLVLNPDTQPNVVTDPNTGDVWYDPSGGTVNAIPALDSGTGGQQPGGWVSPSTPAPAFVDPLAVYTLTQ